MKITKELNLTNFKFWSGAKQHSFTHLELSQIENQIDELYPSGVSETDINDLFWFEEEFLCEIIGLNFEEYQNR